MFRRRRLPTDLAPVADSFRAVLELVEAAKQSVVDAVPRARDPGRPLADALLEFEERLREGTTAMDAWRHPTLDATWKQCRAGLDEALRRAERLRAEGPEMSFDQLAFTVQDLIAPLEPFEAAAAAFRILRS